MTDSHLPTASEMLTRAAEELDLALRHAEECLAWLRSDWRPVGSALTREQADSRQRMRQAAVAVKQAVEAAKEGR